MAETAAKDRSPTRLQRSLDTIERVGNKVPNPAIIFLALIVVLVLLSHLLHVLGVSATYETGAGEAAETTTVDAESLLSADGIRFMFTSPVANLNGFGVVGVAIVSMVGVGLAERVGLIRVMISRMVRVTPKRLVTAAVVLLGVMSSVATDAGYLVLIPLAAAVFHSLGRHPLAGLAAGFAGVSGGFGVNVLITPVDGMLVDITNGAIGDAGDPVAITGNFYFGIVSTLLVVAVSTLLTEKFVEPRLGAYRADEALDPESVAAAAGEHEITAAERRGLRFAGLSALAITVLVLALTLPPGAPLRNPDTGSLVDASPFLNSAIFLILVYFFVMGVAYGLGAKVITGAKDVIDPMTKTIASLSGLFVLLLVIAQFVAYFQYTQLATIAAVHMAEALESSGLPIIMLVIGLVLMIALVDVILPNAVPKWAIFAPIVVPLFLQLGVSPDVALAAYRVGDSPINIVTPLMAYYALIVAFAERYRKNVGMGSIIALMLPYSVVLLVTWTALLAAWYALGIPMGPGGTIHL